MADDIGWKIAKIWVVAALLLITLAAIGFLSIFAAIGGNVLLSGSNSTIQHIDGPKVVPGDQDAALIALGSAFLLLLYGCSQMWLTLMALVVAAYAIASILRDELNEAIQFIGSLRLIQMRMKSDEPKSPENP